MWTRDITEERNVIHSHVKKSYLRVRNFSEITQWFDSIWVCTPDEKTPRQPGKLLRPVEGELVNEVAASTTTGSLSCHLLWSPTTSFHTGAWGPSLWCLCDLYQHPCRTQVIITSSERPSLSTLETAPLLLSPVLLFFIRLTDIILLVSYEQVGNLLSCSLYTYCRNTAWHKVGCSINTC